MIGSYRDACDFELLAACGVSHVLTVGGGLRPRFEGHLRYHVVAVEDDEVELLVNRFAECFEFIDDGRAGGRTVFVHWCEEGEGAARDRLVSPLTCVRTAIACVLVV